MRLDENYLADPYSTWQRLRQEEPVMPVVMPRGARVWLVTRYADVRAALAEPKLGKDSRRLRELFDLQRGPNSGPADRDSLGAHMLNSDPPDHERLRRLVNKAFTTRRIEQLRPRIEQITADLLAGIGTGGDVDLLDTFAFPLPITVICELLGMPTDDRDDFRRWSNLLITGGEPDEMRDAQRSMTASLVGLVAAKRAEPGADMLSALVQAATRTTGCPRRN